MKFVDAEAIEYVIQGLMDSVPRGMVEESDGSDDDVREAFILGYMQAMDSIRELLKVLTGEDKKINL